MQSALKGLKKILLHATKVLRQRLKNLCRSLYLPNTSQDPDHHAKHGIALIVYQIIQWQLTLALEKQAQTAIFKPHRPAYLPSSNQTLLANNASLSA